MKKLIKGIIDALFFDDNGNDPKTVTKTFGDKNIIIIRCNKENGETDVSFREIETLDKENLAPSIKSIGNEIKVGKLKYKYYYDSYNKMKWFFNSRNGETSEEMERIKNELKEEIKKIFNKDCKNEIEQYNNLNKDEKIALIEEEIRSLRNLKND